MKEFYEKSELTAGNMYCCVTADVDYDGQPYSVDGELVFFGGDGNFYDADTLEEINPYYDYLIEQIGQFNAEIAAIEPYAVV